MFCVPSIHPETTWDPGALGGVLLVVCSSTDQGWGQHSFFLMRGGSWSRSHHWTLCNTGDTRSLWERERTWWPGGVGAKDCGASLWDLNWCFQYYTKSTIIHHTPAWEVPPTIHHETSWWCSRFQPADTVFICVPPIHRGPRCVGGDASSQHSNSNPIDDGDHEPSWSWDPLSLSFHHQTYNVRCWV